MATADSLPTSTTAVTLAVEAEIVLEKIIRGKTLSPVGLEDLERYARKRDRRNLRGDKEEPEEPRLQFGKTLAFLVAYHRYEAVFAKTIFNDKPASSPPLSSLGSSPLRRRSLSKPLLLTPRAVDPVKQLPPRPQSILNLLRRSLALSTASPTRPPSLKIFTLEDGEEGQGSLISPVLQRTRTRPQSVNSIQFPRALSDLDHDSDAQEILQLAPVRYASRTVRTSKRESDADPFFHHSHDSDPLARDFPSPPLSSGALPSSPSPYRASVNPTSPRIPRPVAASVPVFSSSLPPTVSSSTTPLGRDLERIVQVYLCRGGKRELFDSVPGYILDRAVAEARFTTHPSILTPIAEHLTSKLEIQLVSPFVKDAMRNISRTTALQRLALAIISALLALLFTAVFIFVGIVHQAPPTGHGAAGHTLPPIGMNRAWRIVSLPFVILAVGLALAHRTGICMILLLPVPFASREVEEEEDEGAGTPWWKFSPKTRVEDPFILAAGRRRLLKTGLMVLVMVAVLEVIIMMLPATPLWIIQKS